MVSVVMYHVFGVFIECSWGRFSLSFERILFAINKPVPLPPILP